MHDSQQPNVTIVPAAPGWYISALYHGTDHLTDDPIVAWEITRYKRDQYRVRPVDASRSVVISFRSARTATSTPTLHRRSRGGCCVTRPDATTDGQAATLDSNSTLQKRHLRASCDIAPSN